MDFRNIGTCAKLHRHLCFKASVPQEQRLCKHYCYRLHREVVVATSLEVYKARLDRALSNLIYSEVSPPMAGGLELDVP